jgi:hypothetical protein
MWQTIKHSWRCATISSEWQPFGHHWKWKMRRYNRASRVLEVRLALPEEAVEAKAADNW